MANRACKLLAVREERMRLKNNIGQVDGRERLNVRPERKERPGDVPCMEVV